MGMGTEAPLLEAYGGRSELEPGAGGEPALGDGAAVPCLRPQGGQGDCGGQGAAWCSQQLSAEGCGRKVTVCNGISSLAAELAGKSLHKKRLQSAELGG